jgi:hypothetical protein
LQPRCVTVAARSRVWLLTSAPRSSTCQEKPIADALLTGGADAGKFTIGSTPGALSFITAPNFELPTDAGGNNVYDVSVHVSDGNGGSDTQAIAVTVTPVNDAPVNYAPVLTVLSQAVDAGQILQMSDLISATDQDGDALNYFLFDGTVGGGHLAVDGAEQAAGQLVNLTAAQLAQTTFVSHVGDSDDLAVRASDGSLFSGWGHIHVEVAIEHAPVVLAPNQTVDAAPAKSCRCPI